MSKGEPVVSTIFLFLKVLRHRAFIQGSIEKSKKTFDLLSNVLLMVKINRNMNNSSTPSCVVNGLL